MEINNTPYLRCFHHIEVSMDLTTAWWVLAPFESKTNQQPQPLPNLFRVLLRQAIMENYAGAAQLDIVLFKSTTNNSHQLPNEDWGLWRRSKSLRIWEPPDSKPLDERTKLYTSTRSLLQKAQNKRNTSQIAQMDCNKMTKLVFGV